jgi:serine/threonine-protein kinase
MGTPYYMSPEQMMGAKNVDHRTDLWSLAVVAYYAITGVRPFVGETYGALAVAIANAPLPQPTLVNPMLPPAIDRWFARACNRDLAARYSTARELAEAFNAAVNGSASMATGAYAVPVPGQTTSLPTVNYHVTGTGEPVAKTNPEMLPATERAGAKKGPPVALFAVLGVLLLGAAAGAFVVFGRGTPKTDESETPSTPAKKPTKPQVKEEPTDTPSATASAAPSAAPTEEIEELPTQAESSTKTPTIPGTKVAPKPSTSASVKTAPSVTAKPPGKKYNDDIK